MTEPTRRRRDPVARKQAIVDAAAEIVAEQGPAGLSHRSVATRAQVPLGSTTQYFDSLQDMRAAALERMAQDLEDDLASLAVAIADTGDIAAAIATWLHAYLTDEAALRSDVVLSSAVVLDPTLRHLARQWTADVTAMLSPHIGAAAALAVSMYADGATWHAALHDTPLGVDELADAIRALLTLSGEERS